MHNTPHYDEIDTLLRHAFEMSPAEVKEVIRDGKAEPLAEYLAGLAEGLELLANEEGRIRIEKSSDTTPAAPETETIETDEEWDSSLPQLQTALDKGSPQLVAAYLREAAQVLVQLSRVLNPDPEFRNWRLQFKRRGRGRRSEPVKKMFKDSAIRMQLQMKTNQLGKQEAAISQIKEQSRLSRATIFRAKKATKINNKASKKK